MKKLNVLTLSFFMILGISLNAQFDDLYYIESDNDNVSIDYSTEDTSYDSADYSDFDSADYSDYDYYSEYDNYYTSRIRRFSRPVGTSYYNSYYSNSIGYDPFLSYYTPSYVVFDRLSRSYVRTNNRVGRGFVSYATSPYGFYGQPTVFRNPYIGTTRFIGVRPSFGGGLASRGGGYGCPVGAPIATRIQPVGVVNPRTATRGTYNGTRRASATRTTTGYRGTTSRSTSRTGVRSTTAPRTRSTTRTSTPRSSISRSSTRTSRSSSGSRSTIKRSGTKRSSFKSSSPSRSSFRSSGSRSSSRRGR